MIITGLQIAILGGCLVGAGLTVVIARLVPAQVDAKWAMGQLDQQQVSAQTPDPTAVETADLRGRIGVMIQRHAPSDRGWARVSHKDLAVIDRPAHAHLGEKGLLVLVGLISPPLLWAFASLIGLGLPPAIPFVGSLMFAALLWKAPDVHLRTEAKKARREFVRALATYVDLVALERASGTGSTQALEAAAEVGDSRVFTRIGEELAHARWAGQTPWERLKDMADDLGVPELADLAEIMRLSREEGATVYTQLMARSSSMRNAQLSADLAKANAASEQMAAPVSLLALVFLALLGAPAILRIAFG